MDLTKLDDKLALTAAIRKDIDQFSLTFDDGYRKHLGASLIGNDCNRYLWYMFRWAFKADVDPRMYRLWQRGHREEPWLWGMLRACGWTILDVDPATGKQWRVDAVQGHFGGSLDAIGLPPAHYGINEWVMVECKTNKSGENGRKWSELEQQGFERNKPQHWAQASTYGYLKGIRIVVYFNVNKDTDALHIEPTIMDWEVGRKMVAKAEFVILSNSAPDKLYQNMSMYTCKYCDARELCHMGKPVTVNCRSCRYAQPIADKQWYCNGYKQVLSQELIATGCQSHQPVIQ